MSCNSLGFLSEENAKLSLYHNNWPRKMVWREDKSGIESPSDRLSPTLYALVIK
jgi:hypothetical protein